MTLKEIKQALKDGKEVCWSNLAYDVKKNGEEYNIICNLNNHCIGLTWRDNKTMNGKEQEFFIKRKDKNQCTPTK